LFFSADGVLKIRHLVSSNADHQGSLLFVPTKLRCI